MDWARLALDYIDTLVWPLAVVGLVVFFLIRFRENTALLIDRIIKVKGPAGMGLDTPLPGPQEPVDLDATAAAEAKGAGEAVQELTRKYGTQIGELTEAAEAARRETNSYAMYYFYYQFERIYRVIYGTQIWLLQYLGERLNKTAPSQDLVNFFDSHRGKMANMGEQPLEYDGYLNFLKQSELIEDAGDEALRLTTWGESFLGYIRAVPVSKGNPY